VADSRTLEIVVAVKDLATKQVDAMRRAFLNFTDGVKIGFREAFTGFWRSIGERFAGFILDLPKMLLDAGAAFLKYADDVQKLSAALGTTTESLTAMTFAAEQSGLSQAELAKDTKFLVKALDEARNKAGDQRLAFQKLGIDVNALSEDNLDLVDIYARLADGVANVNDPIERSALLMKVLGRSGHEAGLLLSEGGAGIRKLADDAERLGIVLEGGVIKNADRVGDALNSIKGFFRGLLFTVAREVLPTIAQAFEGFVEFLKNNRDGVASVLRGLGRAFVSVFVVIVDAATLMAGGIRVAFNAVLASFKAVELGFLKTKKLLKTPDATGIQQFLFPGIARENAKEQEQLTKDITKAQEEFDNLVAGTSIAVLVDYKATWDRLKKSIADAGKEKETFAGKGGQAIDTPGFFAGFKKGVEDFSESLQSTFNQARQFAFNLLQGGQQVLAGFFENIISGALNAKQAFKQMAQDILKLLAQMVAKFLAAQAVGLIFGTNATGGGAPNLGGRGGGVGEQSFRGGGLSPQGAGIGGGLGRPGGGAGGGAPAVTINVFATDAASFENRLAAPGARRKIADALLEALTTRRDVRGAVAAI
jgi:hypothetical protein